MNSAIPESLLTAYRKKTLLPIVGAGVSMALRNKVGDRIFPSWKELLERAANKLKEEQKPELATAILGVLPVGGYQAAADYARRGLTGGLWDQFFKENFQIKKSDIDEVSLALPKAVWMLSSRIITLNYDRVLRFACPAPDEMLELDNTKRNALADFKRDSIGAPAVWHLHGSLDNLDKIIFTSESYSKLYYDRDSDYRAAIETFRAVCSTSSLLFIGCGLDDAVLLQQLEREYSIFAGNAGPHYALVPAHQLVQIQEKLHNVKIELIGFSDFGQSLLDQLGAIATPSHLSLGAASSVKVEVKGRSGKASPVSVQKNITRIAVLVANPIGENYQYDNLLAEFKSLGCEISYFSLSVRNLNALENFDYIFLLSNLVKKKIVIEDEALQGRRIGLKELEDCIGNATTGCVFMFLNFTKIEDLDPDEVQLLSLPTIIFPVLEKQQTSSFAHKIFKKEAFNYVENSIVANRHAIKVQALTGKFKENRKRTPLPDLIDPKTTKNYIGRRVDLENICRQIIELLDKNEVLTIKGSGGIGKTITVKKIAVSLAERGLFSDGIDFIDCEFISDYATFEKKIAANFGLENAIGVRKQIRENAVRAERLIILDNFEPLLYLTEQQNIRDFIYFICDYATVVVTSRELLKLECEQVYELRAFTTDEAYELFSQQLKPRVIEFGEQRYIRENIVESLLDNNPLAIKLVANNIPRGKSFADLKHELEENFFRKANDAELVDFDRVGDGNIERRKSLYASIHLSYCYLNETEKMAFELLSLFPDGINMENLKRIAGDRKADQRNPGKRGGTKKQSTIITDVVIKALEDKSMTQVDRRIIKLQSIVGKFAEYQLNKRSSVDLVHHYQNATAYNISIAEYLIKLAYDDEYQSCRIFNMLRGNFFKSVNFVRRSGFDDTSLLDYLDNLANLTISTASSAAFSHVMEDNIEMFDDPLSIRCFNSILCYVKYHAGVFDEALEKITTIVPISSFNELAVYSPIESIMVGNAMAIYKLEGGEVEDVRYRMRQKIINPSGAYPSSLFKIGIVDKALLQRCKNSFFTLEAKHSIGQLQVAEVIAYAASLYEKDHLGLMEAYYLKAKLGVVDKARIKKIAHVNPFTRGLQQLMYAMAEMDSEQKNALFEQALCNLQHIKYYYVEALVLYARHLKQIGHYRYSAISREGFDLASLHQYRWLRYNFEDLEKEKEQSYDVSDYPLKEALDIDGHLNFLIKKSRR